MFGQNGIIIDCEVKFECPASFFHGDDLLSAVWHHKGHAYFVWTDIDCRPFVTKVSDTTNAHVTAPLDPNPDYKAHRDGHHRFSIGLDKNGFIHVVGDMHNHTSWSNPMYIKRYQNTHMMYWISAAPESVDAFNFVGKAVTMPGAGWTYGRFFADKRGELYHAARVKAIDGGHTPGEIGYGLYAYDATAKAWSAIGGLADNVKQGNYYPVLFWENGGFAGKTTTDAAWYQGLLNKINFDHNDVLHVACGINSDPKLAGNNVLLYAYSKDYGKTWYKADHTKIAGLPLRALPHANQAHVVATVAGEPYFDSKISVAVDDKGTPAVISGGYSPNWFFWFDGKWQKDLKEYRKSDVPYANGCLNAADGASVLTVSPIGVMLHCRGYDKIAFGYEPFGYKDLYSLALTKEGAAYGVGKNEAGLERLLKFTPRKAPLPAGWQSTDINKSGYAGVCGFDGDKFVLTNFGTDLSNQADNCHFAYTKLVGDGFITCKVDQQNISGNGRAGLMIRESLVPGAKSFFLGASPDSTNHKGIASYRRGPDTYCQNYTTQELVKWFKLERVGQRLTASVSVDGVTWSILVAITDLTLGSEVLIGLAGASHHRYGMQTATFSEVKTSIAPAEKKITITSTQFDTLAAKLKKDLGL